MPNTPKGATFQNPVYSRSFPDPFVLKFSGHYFAYCTGLTVDGRCFGRLHSTNLIDWDELPGAMPPLPTGEPLYWAPEVSHLNGKFYLYYSVGNESLMRIRVGTADLPDGEFVDAGVDLTRQEFAIDPHIFKNGDGRMFMFYATDFLDHSHIGTGIVVDEMIDPFTLKGEPRPVTRAKFDWQVYDPARKEKGGVRWHTVEGPFVIKKKNIYYEMFSGGNWQNVSYGVSYSVTDTLNRKDEWPQYSDGVATLPVLHTIPGKVIGPGHNSIVRGPNNRETYCIYHRWHDTDRVLAIDRMDIAGAGRLFVIGPSVDVQLAPYVSQISDSFSRLDMEQWTIRDGEWFSNGNELVCSGDGGEIVHSLGANSFLCSLYLRLIGQGHSRGGVVIRNKEKEIGRLMLRSEGGHVCGEWSSNTISQQFDLPQYTDVTAFNEVTLDIDNLAIKITFDGIEIPGRQRLSSPADRIGLATECGSTAFAAFSATYGFENLFDVDDDLNVLGWSENDPTLFKRANQVLMVSGTSDGHAAIFSRVILPGDFDLAINLRFDDSERATVRIECSNTFIIENKNEWRISTPEKSFCLPPAFAVNEFYQFRFVSMGHRTTIFLNAVALGTVENRRADLLRIGVQNGTVSFDMIRHTLI